MADTGRTVFADDLWASNFFAAGLWAGGVAGTAPTITTTTLSGGNVGAYFSRNLFATGDTPITWTVSVGSLPGGLSLDSSTGIISGIPTTEETQAFTVEADNAAGSDTQALSITIGAALAASTTRKAAIRSSLRSSLGTTLAAWR